mmetsp:Transcript_17242/g.44801  ORF Transcript_17242/g.44801 Transcript_17242/m.44801 type:complete len:161 (+) Transcript_17242:3-485(+)
MAVTDDTTAGTLPLPTVLVVRRHGARSLGNHDEVVAAFETLCSDETLGLRVTVFDSTNATVREQAALFRQSALVVAPHGSGLSNCVFLRPGAIVIELLPWEYPNLTFYVALSWLPVLHAAMVVDGANAYGAMVADVRALTEHLRELRLEQLETGIFAHTP